MGKFDGFFPPTRGMRYRPVAERPREGRGDPAPRIRAYFDELRDERKKLRRATGRQRQPPGGQKRHETAAVVRAQRQAMRGHRHAVHAKPLGPSVWRGGRAITTAPDGVGPMLAILRMLARRRDAWWTHREVRDATGMPQNRYAPAMMKCRRRRWVAVMEVWERGLIDCTGRQSHIRCRHQITREGMDVVRICG